MNKSNHNSSREGRGFLEYLAVKAALPSDVVAKDFRMEMRGRHTLFLHGCRRILKYSPQEMVMEAKGITVCVTGERLVCSTFHDGTVTVDGLLHGLLLEGEEEA